MLILASMTAVLADGAHAAAQGAAARRASQMLLQGDPYSFSQFPRRAISQKKHNFAEEKVVPSR
jgi:hypothetical protein